jgi:hypothetical protein
MVLKIMKRLSKWRIHNRKDIKSVIWSKRWQESNELREGATGMGELEPSRRERPRKSLFGALYCSKWAQRTSLLLSQYVIRLYNSSSIPQLAGGRESYCRSRILEGERALQ